METHTYRDIYAFKGSVRGVDCAMLLQNPIRRIWTISQVSLPEIPVQLGRLGSGNIVEGQSWSGGYLLYLPLTDACAYSANGTVLEKGSFAILAPGCEFCVSTKDEHDWCTIFVPSHKFAAHDDLVHSASGSAKTTTRVRVSPPNLQLAIRFREYVHQVLTTAAQCTQFESTPAASSAAADLMKLAYLIVGQRPASEPNPEGRPRHPRPGIIRRTKELLEERKGKPVHVGELAAAADVSERTLRTAFHEYFGVGPVRYLQLRQLNQVHRALKVADPEADSVGDVLVKNGVWEFSRFAARYRQLFGERPSQTMQTK